MAKILLAVRDPDERSLYEFALRFAGYQVLKAGSADEIYRQARENRPELWVVEAALLGQQEVGAGNSITTDRLSASVPIVVIGEVDHEVDGVQSVNLAMVRLAKPISTDSLTRKVNQSLRGFRKQVC